jgi:putative copper resistance protein D
VSDLLLAHGDVPAGPLSLARFLALSDPASLIAVGLLVAAVAYGWGTQALRRRGDHWPVGRTVMFGLGLAVVGLVTVTGFAAYDDVQLSIHMIQHMVLSMVGPICLALGAPVTLALRTLPARPRRVLLAVLHSRPAKVLTFPLVSYGIFVASPFALYFTGLYKLTLEHDWLHEFVHLHFIVSGCLFFWPLIGVDPVPGKVSYPLRALMMFLATPFHTVLGLTVMQSMTLLGGDWYPSLHLWWVDPYADQNLAGGILWAGGEFVSVTMLAALVVQWMRASEKEARRVDRALDRVARSSAADVFAPEPADAIWERPWWETGADTPVEAPQPTGTISQQRRGSLTDD